MIMIMIHEAIWRCGSLP